MRLPASAACPMPSNFRRARIQRRVRSCGAAWVKTLWPQGPHHPSCCPATCPGSCLLKPFSPPTSENTSWHLGEMLSDTPDKKLVLTFHSSFLGVAYSLVRRVITEPNKELHWKVTLRLLVWQLFDQEFTLGRFCPSSDTMPEIAERIHCTPVLKSAANCSPAHKLTSQVKCCARNHEGKHVPMSPMELPMSIALFHRFEVAAMERFQFNRTYPKGMGVMGAAPI